jgi:hypothetical protein
MSVENLDWAEKFIKNFNDIYEKEDQIFFIKIHCGEHGKKYVAFVFHPTIDKGNCVCPVYLENDKYEFIKDMKCAFITIATMNKEYHQNKNILRIKK